jgi:PilZ domain
MASNQRKAARQATSAAGFLYSTDGWPLGECQMKDVSATGAKLAHKIADEMPRQVLLAFSRNGQVRRHCHVVWTKENEIGVRFVTKS